MRLGNAPRRRTPVYVILRCTCGSIYQRKIEHRHRIRVRMKCPDCGEKLLAVKWGDRWEQV